MPECPVCDEPLDPNSAGALYAEVGGSRYLVSDALCKRLVEEYPIDVLGPRVELRCSRRCPKCLKLAGIWLEAAQRRPLRLTVLMDEFEECARLLVEGKHDPFTQEIEDLDRLLDSLYADFPGPAGCC